MLTAVGSPAGLTLPGDDRLHPCSDDLRERPDALVVMDNLGAHKAEAVRRALDRAGLAHRYLPSYSPDLNPIERAWSKLKTRLRAVGARSKEALEQALGPALATITAQDARGWFRLAGYPSAE